MQYLVNIYPLTYVLGNTQLPQQQRKKKRDNRKQ